MDPTRIHGLTDDRRMFSCAAVLRDRSDSIGCDSLAVVAICSHTFGYVTGSSREKAILSTLAFFSKLDPV